MPAPSVPATALWCWGNNPEGQLGNGTSGGTNPTPGQVTDITAVVGLSCWRSSCAVLTDGTAWCWGFGVNGELGNGATVNSSVPVPVTDPY